MRSFVKPPLVKSVLCSTNENVPYKPSYCASDNRGELQKCWPESQNLALQNILTIQKKAIYGAKPLILRDYRILLEQLYHNDVD